MPVVTVYNNNVDKALRKFKKKVNNAGILEEVRKREYFEKPSMKRKRAKAAAVSRYRKKMQKEAPKPRQR